MKYTLKVTPTELNMIMQALYNNAMDYPEFINDKYDREEAARAKSYNQKLERLSAKLEAQAKGEI